MPQLRGRPPFYITREVESLKKGGPFFIGRKEGGIRSLLITCGHSNSTLHLTSNYSQACNGFDMYARIFKKISHHRWKIIQAQWPGLHRLLKDELGNIQINPHYIANTIYQPQQVSFQCQAPSCDDPIDLLPRRTCAARKFLWLHTNGYLLQKKGGESINK